MNVGYSNFRYTTTKTIAHPKDINRKNGLEKTREMYFTAILRVILNKRDIEKNDKSWENLLNLIQARLNKNDFKERLVFWPWDTKNMRTWNSWRIWTRDPATPTRIETQNIEKQDITNLDTIKLMFVKNMNKRPRHPYSNRNTKYWKTRHHKPRNHKINVREEYVQETPPPLLELKHKILKNKTPQTSTP